MRICCFGDYDPDYSRTRILLRGLSLQGVEIVHCNLREEGFITYLRLAKKLLSFPRDYDLILIPMSNARLHTLIAKLLQRKPVIWEPLFSLYDNWVNDRRLVVRHHPKAWFYWLLDWISCVSSNLIILDNESHIDYFHRTFFAPREKMVNVLIGGDDRIFQMAPYPQKHEIFEVEFHGGYIPVQGPDIIVRAAKILEGKGVHFTMIGSGQESARTRKLAKDLGVTNITFYPFLDQSAVSRYMAAADVCLGHTGDRPRVVRSLPNKLYEAAAMARVSINVDTPALREVFTPGVDVVGIKPGDPDDLARVILELKDSGKSKEMGEAAYDTYIKVGTSERIGKKLFADLNRKFFALPCAL